MALFLLNTPFKYCTTKFDMAEIIIAFPHIL